MRIFEKGLDSNCIRQAYLVSWAEKDQGHKKKFKMLCRKEPRSFRPKRP